MIVVDNRHFAAGPMTVEATRVLKMLVVDNRHFGADSMPVEANRVLKK